MSGKFPQSQGFSDKTMSLQTYSTHKAWFQMNTRRARRNQFIWQQPGDGKIWFRSRNPGPTMTLLYGTCLADRGSIPARDICRAFPRLSLQSLPVFTVLSQNKLPLRCRFESHCRWKYNLNTGHLHGPQLVCCPLVE